MYTFDKTKHLEKINECIANHINEIAKATSLVSKLQNQEKIQREIDEAKSLITNLQSKVRVLENEKDYRMTSNEVVNRILKHPSFIHEKAKTIQVRLSELTKYKVLSKKNGYFDRLELENFLENGKSVHIKISDIHAKWFKS